MASNAFEGGGSTHKCGGSLIEETIENTKKICEECGHELEESMTVCPNCGCPIPQQVEEGTTQKKYVKTT